MYNIDNLCYPKAVINYWGKIMGRLSIEISESQHQQIKAMAALRGLSIKEYILLATLPPPELLAQLAVKASHMPPIEQNEYNSKTINKVIMEARLRNKKEEESS